MIESYETTNRTHNLVSSTHRNKNLSAGMKKSSMYEIEGVNESKDL